VVCSAAEGVSRSDGRTPGGCVNYVGFVHEVAESHAVRDAGIWIQESSAARADTIVGVAVNLAWSAANLGSGRAAMGAMLAGSSGRGAEEACCDTNVVAAATKGVSRSSSGLTGSLSGTVNHAGIHRRVLDRSGVSCTAGSHNLVTVIGARVSTRTRQSPINADKGGMLAMGGRADLSGHGGVIKSALNRVAGNGTKRCSLIQTSAC
jgi:hypothetical protein